MTDIKYPNNHTTLKQLSLGGEYLLPYFLLSQSVCVLLSSDKRYFSSTFFVDKSFWAKFFTICKLSVPSKLPVIVDGLQYSGTEG